jgi:hypothetical protein
VLLIFKRFLLNSIAEFLRLDSKTGYRSFKNEIIIVITNPLLVSKFMPTLTEHDVHPSTLDCSLS